MLFECDEFDYNLVNSVSVMLGRSCVFIKHSIIRLIHRNQTRKMTHLPKVIVKNVQDEDNIKISFRYGRENFTERQFNFNRSKDEPLDISISRIKQNIANAISKKTKKAKVNVADCTDELKLDVSLTYNDQVLEGNVVNSEAWKEGSVLRVGESAYEVNLNAPLVAAFSLPKNIMAGFPVYPKIALEFSVKDDCIFTWYRTSKDEKQALKSVEGDLVIKRKGEVWVKVGDGFFYMTSNSDIGHRLKIICTPKCGERCGLDVEVNSNNPVEAGPGLCPFEERHLHTKELTNNECIRCISYNILADLYADSDYSRTVLYPYCAEKALELDYRKQLWLKELLGYNGDIFCLQEVDTKVFNHDLIPVLTTAGLGGVFHEKGGQVAEGHACFFRTSKFKVIQNHSIVLSEALKTEALFQNICAKISENEKLKERFLARTTSLQVVLLESVEKTNRKILVGNTHLYFYPEADHIRLLQASMCLSYMSHLLNKYQKEEPNDTIGFLLCGDFNSCPENGVLQLMMTGFVPEDSPDWTSIPEESISGMTASHSFHIGSACGTPSYTNYTSGFNGCLDYIFYDKEHFGVSAVVPLPSHEQVIQHTALPSVVCPSDHLALVCTLEWK